MQLSTKTRYGLRAMITIARNWKKPVSSEVIADAESVSKKYLDGILGILRSAGLLRSFKGQGGGYMLARPPWEITARDVVLVLEEGLALVPCMEDPEVCEKIGTCPTREMWQSLSAAMSDTLGKVTLAELTAWEPGTESRHTGYYI
jgi:Rrf2 family protein